VTFTRFTEIKDTGKTKVWNVHNCNDGSWLGHVKWHGAWRKYVFVPAQSIWSADCLRDVADFIDEQTRVRRSSKMQRGVCKFCGESIRKDILWIHDSNDTNICPGKWVGHSAPYQIATSTCPDGIEEDHCCTVGSYTGRPE
jgi:hypothetical protein